MKLKKKSLLVAVLSVILVDICLAGGPGDLSKENAELRTRVEKLERELEELKKIVTQNAKEPKAQKAPAAAAVHKLNEEQVAKLMEMAEAAENKKPVWSDLDIELYGYIKADASYDTSRTTSGNYVVYLDSETNNDNDNEFNLTGNETRLGMRINAPEENGIKTSGRVEFDFYGSGGAENKAKIQMRHAYMQMDWPEDNFSILAGQTSDVMSPLNPHTLNYTVLWDVGNIGYRRPQIRATKNFKFNGTSFKFEGAIARNIGRDDLTGSESGEDSGLPSFQGRASLTFPWFGHKPTTVGFSGHWGKEEYDLSSSGSNTEFDSSSLNVDVTQPVNEWLTIKGEVFTGENLNTYFGGIGQGVNTTKLKEINSMGGWVAASLGPWDRWSFNVGAGVDDADSRDLNSGNRTLNRTIFGNMIYSLNKNTEVGFELSHWRTEYVGHGDADSMRAQTSFIYKF